MTEAIIKRLEAVHVDHDQRNRQIVILATPDLARKRFFHGVAVPEPGEGIGGRMPLEPAYVADALCNILVVAADTF